MGFFCCINSYIATALTILKVLGFFKLLELLYRLVKTFLRQKRTTEHLTERYGKNSWAVVTGGSDGIGLAICLELARRDFNIVIISKNLKKMQAAQMAIWGVSVRCKVIIIEFDFTGTIDHAVEWYQLAIIDRIKDLDISILINNVGYM